MYEVRRTARGLQSGGQADAKGRVPAAARRFVRAQAVGEQGGQELVSMGWREGRSVISSKQGSRLTCTSFNRKA
eukprot:2864899-Pleurochrysis_carterae.AAC.2